VEWNGADLYNFKKKMSLIEKVIEDLIYSE